MSISISGTGAITGATTSYSFDQSVSVGGTVTYEDVTNVDSIGVITARSGLDVGIGGTVITTTPGGNINIDSGGVFYDATNNRLGIGTTSPQRKLVVSEGGAQGFEFFPGDGGGGNTLNHYNRSTSAFISATTNADQHIWGRADGEKARIDSSGRLLVGTPSALSSAPGSNARLTIQGYPGFPTGQAYLALTRGQDASSVSTNNSLGFVVFTDNGGNAFAQILAAVDSGTPGSGSYPGRLVFSTTADAASSPTERMRITNDGSFYVYSVYSQTGGASANVVVDSAGEIFRSTSSIKYKTNVETIEDFYADALLNIRPVWYRSTCDIDNPAHSFWGFIAEEVAEVDPRLVHWKTSEPVVQEDGSLEHVPCDPEPEGVQYDRFVPHLLNLIKRQKEQIEAQGTAIAALETRLSALEAA